MSELESECDLDEYDAEEDAMAALSDRTPGWLRAMVWIVSALALCSLLGRWLWIGNLACNVSGQLVCIILVLLLFCTTFRQLLSTSSG